MSQGLTLEGESGRLEGWQAIEASLQALLMEALQGGAKRLTALDPDFVHWPWSSPELLHELAHVGASGPPPGAAGLGLCGLRSAASAFHGSGVRTMTTGC